MSPALVRANLTLSCATRVHHVCSRPDTCACTCHAEEDA